MSQLPSSQELLSALQQSAQLIQKLEDRLDDYHEPIAIVGMGCRLPGGADSPQDFWRNLRGGVDSVTEIPRQRWDVDQFVDPNPETPGQTVTRYGAFMDQVDQFDPLFFGISPREALKMDPQHRLLLETSWEAIERAAIPHESLRNTPVGVFVGLSAGEYSREVLTGMNDDFYSVTGNITSTAAGRLSFLMGLTGPCLSVDTACSSGLTAVHLACQSLRNRECSMALAGGVYVMLSAEMLALFARGNVFAPDGRCKTFDARANGYVRGEGCGMILLKRLSDALADQDPIVAVIRGTAINQDGPSSGLTVPNGPSQVRVIQDALKNGRVKPDQVSYIEAHGTGTSLGDPIEIGALSTVFQGRSTPLFVGSAKTNIGHLELAAGIAGLIKVALSLQHGEIPKHLHFETPNPYIDWANAPVQIPTETVAWPSSEKGRRMAGVSSFGLSGTNAHIVLAEAPLVEPKAVLRGSVAKPTAYLLTLSAKDEAALNQMAQDYASFLADGAQAGLTDADLGHICHTSHVGRSLYPHRLSIVADSLLQMQSRLAAYAHAPQDPLEEGIAAGYAAKGRKPKVAFLFTGQGSQYIDMGRTLYETQPLFRAILQRCETVVQTHLGGSLIALIYPDGEPNLQKLMESHPWGQAANFAIECALADLWRSWGVEPAVVLGHSLGDFAAAYTAGVLSLEDGLALVIERGRLMEQANGEMLSVLASEAQVQPYIAVYTDVTVGVINGPQSVVLSGGRENMDRVQTALQADGYKTRKLAIPVAAHSPLLDPVLDPFEAAVRRIPLSPPTRPVISSMTGKTVSHELTDPVYWRNHLRNTVRFADGVETLLGQDVGILIEIGPKPTLLGMVDQVTGGQNPIALSSLRPTRPDWQQMLASLGALAAQGVTIDWAEFDRNQGWRRVALPTYPFQRQRYWVDAPKSKPGQQVLSPLIDKKISSYLHRATLFETEFSVAAQPYLQDHRVFDAVVSPGACHLAMVASAAQLAWGSPVCTVEDVIFSAPLVIPLEAARTLQLVFTPLGAEGAGSEFKLLSMGPETDPGFPEEVEPVTHATGQIRPGSSPALAPVQIDDIRQRCPHPMDVTAFYAGLAAQQVVLGPAFRWAREGWQGENEALVRLTLPESIGSLADFPMHPALLDGCFQAAGMLLGEAGLQETLLPFAVRQLQIHQPSQGQSWWCHVTQIEPRQWALQLLDETGQILVSLEGLEMRAAAPEAVQGESVWQEWLYEVTWQAQATFGQPPDYLVTPQQVQNAVSRTAGELLPVATDLDRYGQALAGLEALAMTYVLTALTQSGFTFQPGAIWRTEQIAQQVGVVPRYRRLLARLLAMLGEVGMVQLAGQEWRVLQSPEIGDAQQQAQTLRDRFGAVIERELTLLTRCGPRLSQTLRGLQDPLELLFPGGDTSTALHFYADALPSRTLNTLLRQSLLAALADLPVQQGARILEIGAGTGSTTAALLPHLSSGQTEYTFTDVGPAFTRQAQERFADFPFMRFRTLDIEQSPVAQGFDRGGYDLVIAANVLHATEDLSITLAHIRQLLAPGGQLILLESVARRRWVDLTFGLTDGWWRFADTRRDHPLLTTDQWQALLAENGFAQSVSVAEGDPAWGLAVIAAQTDPVDPAGLETAHPWLLFADAGGVAERLAGQLRARGAELFLVYADSGFQQRDAHTFGINPQVADEYAQLLAALPQVQNIAHLWSLDSPSLDELEQEAGDLVALTKLGCGSALLLTQALLQTQPAPQAFWLVTANAQAVIPGDRVQGAVQAALWGLGRTLALEHPELHCRRVDLGDAASPARQVQTLGAQLLAPPLAAGPEDQLALRQGQRYVSRLSRLALPKVGDLAIRTDGSYLITGGLGGLGLLLATWLAEEGAGQIILMGRSQPTPEAENQLTALRERGVRLLVQQADVTDSDQMGRILHHIDPAFPLRGILHAVGVLDDGALLQQNWSRFAPVLAPKVAGAWNLHRLLAEKSERPALDFFVLFSSAAGLMGSPGQANHAAANAFLDAFAHYRRAQGLPALSINWGVWSEVGAAAEMARLNHQSLAARGSGVIPPRQGIAAHARLLHLESPQAAVMPIHWPRFLQTGSGDWPFVANFRDLAIHADPVPSAVESQQTFRQDFAATPAEKQPSLLVHHLRAAAARVLGMGGPGMMDPRQGLMEMGMDSLMAVELRNHLVKSLEIPLPPTLLFDYPTIEKLADFLLPRIQLQPPTQAAYADEPRPTRPPALAGPSLPEGDADLHDLSADELAALLAQELDELQ